MRDPSGHPSPLQDGFGRSFPYLRLSITDVCNFRCTYCLPNGYQGNAKASFLNPDEIRRLVTAFAELGTYKIRLTGGEPTVRRDFTQIAHMVAGQAGIKQLAVTTNGYKLKDNAQTWRDAGLTHINISMDSLDRETFHGTTGQDKLPDVLAGIDAAIEAEFRKVKINAVLLNGVNSDALPEFMHWIKDKPVSVRFIELMQTGDNKDYFDRYHVSADILSEQLRRAGWTLQPRPFEAGPAKEFSHPDYMGRIGLIAPYSKDFCDGCNRLRVTAKGDLRLCLFGELGIPLRPLLQSDDQKPDLIARIQKQLAFKKSSHFLHQGQTGLTPHLASVGG